MTFEEIKSEIDMARQMLQEDLRDHLGLYDWNKGKPPNGYLWARSLSKSE